MNTTISELQADLDQAETTLASIKQAIADKSKELEAERAEAQRLDNLVLLKGDHQAMLDMVRVKATIKGIEDHLAQLNRASTTAGARRDAVESELLEAQARSGDAEGYLNPEELAKVADKLREQIDKIAHGTFQKLEAHNQACDELTAQMKRSKQLKRENVPWDFKVGGHVSLGIFHGDNVSKSLSRYETPRIAKSEADKLKAIREAADIQREAIGASALMFDRIMDASGN